MPFVSVFISCLVTLTVSLTGNNYCLLLEVDTQCTPEGALCILEIPLEGTLCRCESSTQRPNIRLCDQSFDLMDCFDILWDEGENVIFSGDDCPGVCPRNWLPHRCYMGVLEVTGVRFDAIVWSLFHAGKSLFFGMEPMMPDVTEVGHKISMTTSTCSWGDEFRCSGWLWFVSQRAGLMVPIGARICTVVFFWSGGGG